MWVPDGAILKPKRLRAGFLHVWEESKSEASGQRGKKGNQEGEGKASPNVCFQCNHSLEGRNHFANGKGQY